MSFYDLPFFTVVPSDGKDGVSPSVQITDIDGGHELTITDATGTRTVKILDGVEGPAGPQGLQGVPGPQGERGLTGERGPTGETGPRGETGLTGERGPAGEQGPRGETGLTGERGPQGEPGLQGERGLQGETGAAGHDGKDGLDGKSAYTYAQEGGYAGTETDFIQTLASVLNKKNVSLGIHTDGLLYIFVDGEPIGTGIEKTIQTDTK